MNNKMILALLSLAFVAVSAAVLADGLAGATSLDLTWNTIDAGGGISTAPSLELHGTIGQPDASITITGSNFELVGGFWPGAVEPATPCPADIAGDDGLINIDDLLLVINFWGQGGVAPGDVNHNGTVNIDDLLLIINAWGACPL